MLSHVQDMDLMSVNPPVTFSYCIKTKFASPFLHWQTAQRLSFCQIRTSSYQARAL